MSDEGDSGARAVEVSDVAPDGSPVEIYRHLPPNGEAEIVHEAIPDGSTILELGAGAGRVTRRLVALGHRVVAVDESAAMLAEIAGADGVETVEARIEELDLGRRFPVVLLGSHLVNSPVGEREPILAAARRHAATDAAVPIEVYSAALSWTSGRSSHLGPVEVVLEDARVDAAHVVATVAYTLGERSWRQPFEADLLDEPTLRRVLEDAGLRFDRWLDERRGWLLARAAGEPQG